MRMLISIRIRVSGAVSAPASLSREDSVGQFRALHGVHKRRASVQGNVVISPVPNGRVGHSVRRKGHHGADDGAGDDVVPVVELVNGEGASDQNGAENGGVDEDELPHGRVVVGEDLELGVEVEVQEDEAGERGRRVATGKGLQAVVDLVWVAGADFPRVENLLVALLIVSLVIGQADVRLADVEEMRSQASDEPLEEHLKDGSGNERVQEANHGVVDVPKRANADLHEQDDDNGNHAGQKGGKPDGDDFVSKRERKLGEDDLAVGKCDGKRSRGRGVGLVDLHSELGC